MLNIFIKPFLLLLFLICIHSPFVFNQIKQIDESLVYSGLIGEWVPININEEETQYVLEFSLLHIERHFYPSIRSLIKLDSIQKTPLNYSATGINASLYNVPKIDPTTGSYIMHKTALTLGHNFILKLLLGVVKEENGLNENTIIEEVYQQGGENLYKEYELHTIVVYQDWDMLLGITRHTWIITNINGTLLPIDDSKLSKKDNQIETKKEIQCRDGVCETNSRTEYATLLSFNIWNYNKDWNKRVEFIEDQILSEDVDIIGWQEVRYENGRTWRKNEPNTPEGKEESKKGLSGRLQIEDLANTDIFNTHQFVFQRANTELYLRHRYPNSFHINEGVAISSKHSILETDYIIMSKNISDQSDMHQRVCLRTLVHIPQCGLINFYTTHLTLSDDARERNIVELWDFVVSHHSDDEDIPSILVGDFNTLPNSTVIKFLLGEVEIEGKSGDFRDSWTSIHTEEEEKGLTFPTWDLKKRIDFVFVKGDVEVEDVYVIGNKTLGSLPKGKKRTKKEQEEVEQLISSDHLGLLSKISYGNCKKKNDSNSNDIYNQNNNNMKSIEENMLL